LVGYDAFLNQKRVWILHDPLEKISQQSAYDEVDTYTSITKQYKLLKIILDL